MKITLPSLAAQVRLQWCALLVVLFVAAAPALHVHPLNLVDANNQPETPVSLAGTNWSGTLAAGRLPTNVQFVNDDGSLSLNGHTFADAGGDLLAAASVYAGGVMIADSGGNVYAGAGAGSFHGASASLTDELDAGEFILTDSIDESIPVFTISYNDDTGITTFGGSTVDLTGLYPIFGGYILVDQSPDYRMPNSDPGNTGQLWVNPDTHALMVSP